MVTSDATESGMGEVAGFVKGFESRRARMERRARRGLLVPYAH